LAGLISRIVNPAGDNVVPLRQNREGEPMSGGYFWVRHTAEVSGGVTRTERCENCGTLFRYRVSRTVSGMAHAPFGLGGGAAREHAERTAREHLKYRLDTAVEPHHCPRCGWYQAPMAKLLKRKLGYGLDPNKYARERVSGTSVVSAWQVAIWENTVPAYMRFMETWPTHREEARERLWKLKHPHLIRWTPRLGWLLWGAVVAFFFAAVVLSGRQ
jgi:hypothetical protein